MACGGCRKSKKTFKHRIRKAKRMALNAKKAKEKANQPEPIEAPVIVEAPETPKAPKKKKKKGISKRGRWLREQRRKKRKAKSQEKPQ